MSKSRRQEAQSTDPVIDEVRAIRKTISDRFSGNLEKMGEYLRQVGEEYRTKTGRFSPQREDQKALPKLKTKGRQA
jgi:hypothetical protein